MADDETPSPLAPEFAPVPPTAPAPVADGERAVVLDVLRGFALLGILSINISIFANPNGMMGIGDSTYSVDRLVEFLITWLVQAKFYSLFSFLFGVGFAVMMRNADREGPAFNARFVRRSLTLLGFGLCHVIFLWEGDILVLYSLVGLLLLAFRTVSDKAIKRWVVGLLGIPFLLALGVFVLIVLLRLIPGVDAAMAKAEVAFSAEMAKESAKGVEEARSNGYFGAMGTRLMHYAIYVFVMITVVPTILGMFLIGLLVGRRRVPMDPAAHLPLLRRTALVGLTAGLGLALFVAVAFFAFPPLTAIPTMFFNNLLAGPLLGLGYAAAITLIYLRTGPALWTKPIAAAGRMALTNYLTQSLVNTILFAGYGFGLTGHVSPTGLLGIVAAIFICQLIFSVVWLRFFLFGPMEWLWRAITYKSWPKMIRR